MLPHVWEGQEQQRSWFMVDAAISGGGGRGSGRPKTPGRPAPRPRDIDLPGIELSQAFGHGRYRSGAADWVEMGRIGRRSVFRNLHE